MNKVHFSHNRDNWKTPKNIYDQYMEIGCFDPCPSKPTFNGLEIEWGQKNFVNPPYSQINKWVDKALEEVAKNKEIWLLVPARTDTKWFHKIQDSEWDNEIYFIEGRLKFDDGKNPAPFPSIIIHIS